jgi:hypothetical protein
MPVLTRPDGSLQVVLPDSVGGVLMFSTRSNPPEHSLK